MANDDLPGPQVTPIGQADQPPPEPADTPAPRAQLVDPGRQDTGGDQGGGAVQANLAQHAYELAQRAERDQENARNKYQGMQEEVKRLYQEEQANAQTPMPQVEPYPEAPKYAYRPLALLHLMMALPGSLFGGNKYDRFGTISGLNDAINEFKNSGSNAQRLAIYREQVNILHQQNEDRLRQYHDLMADKRGDIHTKMEAITTLAGLYKDTATVDAAATDNWEHFSEYLSRIEKANNDYVTNVYGTMAKLHEVFGNSNEDRLYRAWGAENYPDLRDGLFSEDNPRKFGQAVKELEKRKSFYTWQKENWKWMHPSETAGQKEEELTPKPTPPDEPPDDMRKAIQDMHPDLLFGTPKPDEHKEKPKPKVKYDPRKNWLKPDDE